MNETYKQIYLVCFLTILASLGALYYFHRNFTQQESRVQREFTSLEDMKVVAEEIYKIQQEVNQRGKVLSSDDLNMKTIHRLIDKHRGRLGQYYNASTKEYKKKTYKEMRINLTFKSQPLKEMVEFLLDVEDISDTKVSRINITRTKDDKDLWNMDVVILKNVPLELDS
ncbi:MAG: hypothetical protein HQL32_05710 [Planctomycetes bacterium]|nr:hypothetical protein [Planctomycetota bacterium]